MDFVWTTSYLCVFMLGAIISPFVLLKIIDTMVNREEKKLVKSAGKHTLQEVIDGHTRTVQDPFLN